MKTLYALIRRNTKLFFKDKGMFFTALITPAILLVLYATFLGKVYRDSFIMALSPSFSVPETLIDGCVGAQLVSSILAVSCVTVAFCSNMLMVQDRANGSIRDLTVSPVRPSVMAMGYYCATLVSTMIICLAALGLCLAYLAATAWYLTVADILWLILDIFLVVLFGTALSSIIGFFLSSQGQISAVGTIVSSGYGFICGAYMPISQFSEGLQRVISFLPGTYGTSLIRNHAMRGTFAAMAEEGIPTEAIEAVKDSIDCNLYFFDRQVSEGAMLAILCGTVTVLILGYILMNRFLRRKAK